MTTEFRPVDCATHQPLAFNPGFVNQTIYGDRVETGWAWFPYKQDTDNFWAQVGEQNLPITVCSVLCRNRYRTPSCAHGKQGTGGRLLPCGQASHQDTAVWRLHAGLL